MSGRVKVAAAPFRGAESLYRFWKSPCLPDERHITGPRSGTAIVVSGLIPRARLARFCWRTNRAVGFVTTGYGYVLVRPAPSESNVLNHLHRRQNCRSDRFAHSESLLTGSAISHWELAALI
jgi:hypothetical protein